MNKRRTGPAPKLVWRISESAPQGEWVDPGTADQEISAVAKEVASGSSWASSSFDLLQGVDVAEDGPDTLSAELYDELFGANATGQLTSADSEFKSEPVRNFVFEA